MSYDPYATRVPMGTLATKPREVKPEKELPSEDDLRSLLKANQVDLVKTIIQMNDMPYVVENGELRDNVQGTELHLKRFITDDPRCLKLKDDVRKLSKVSDEVLITGATGTGKETIAKAMIGSRTGKTIAVNCAGLPRELIESELFGHDKGAFTGAEHQKQGMLAAAAEGVLFLDEVAELPLDVQGKLLRALQDKRIRRVGSNVETDISCKFVCATHRNLRQMVQDETFRQDLYARISTFELHIPSLKERVSDIPLILSSIKGGKEYMSALESIGKSINDLDVSLNVRSLQRYIKRYIVLGDICYT